MRRLEELQLSEGGRVAYGRGRRLLDLHVEPLYLQTEHLLSELADPDFAQERLGRRAPRAWRRHSLPQRNLAGLRAQHMIFALH